MIEQSHRSALQQLNVNNKSKIITIDKLECIDVAFMGKIPVNLIEYNYYKRYTQDCVHGNHVLALHLTRNPHVIVIAATQH